MKPRWKIILTLTAPLLLILGGVYLRLFLDQKREKDYIVAYYQNVAQPAIAALNRANKGISKLSDQEHAFAMDAMVEHMQNLSKHKEGNARRNKVGYVFLGLIAFAGTVGVISYFDRAKE
jgi:hypothetical protein